MKKEEIELLSPVGSMEALYAAVQNGANAVYLGGKLFNARHYASNFDNDELKEAVKYCHLRDVKVYVTVNILLDDEEIKEALNYVKFLYNISIDGIIVQDIGFARLVHELLPELEIHGSTQMTIHNLEGAKFLYDNGFSRVVLSRETPIEEIKYIKERSPIELEVFVHGALCVSYSGQCLMSSMIGGRSGNRGQCAQPCRMPSSLIDDGGREVLDWQEKHILSPKDLNTVEELNILQEIGVKSLKIEGRMKRPEYVATVTRLYRKSLDFGANNISEKDKKDLKQVFNRGFTKGLSFGDFSKDFISYDRPDNRGMKLGKIVSRKLNNVDIRLEEDIEVGDSLEFVLGLDDYLGIKAAYSGKKGDIYSLEIPKNMEVEDFVYRTQSLSLLKEARETYELENKKRSIDYKIGIHFKEFPKLNLYYKDIEIEVEGDYLVEKSKNIALTEDRVVEQVSKLGDTIYQVNKIDISLDKECFLPMGVLNKLRRDATEKLDEYILSQYRRPYIESEDFNKKVDNLMELKGDRIKSNNLVVSIKSYDHLRLLDLEFVDVLILEYDESQKLEATFKYLEDYEVEVYLSTGKILYRENFEKLRLILNKFKDRLDGVTVSNLGSLYFINENFEDFKIYGEIGLNAYNSYTVDFLKNKGVDILELSAELNFNQIERISNNSSLELSVIGYGYIPVMLTKHCPMSLVKGCKDDLECKTCNFRSGYKIRDRIGAEFLMERKDGYTEIYNSVALMVLDHVHRLRRLGLSVRLSFLNEEGNLIVDLQDKYFKYLKDQINKEEISEFIQDFRQANKITRGHFFRGVLN